MPAAHNRANALEELGFRAGLHRTLALAKPLTVGDAELTCLEFGSPNATLFITKNRELGREFDAGGVIRLKLVRLRGVLQA